MRLRSPPRAAAGNEAQQNRVPPPERVPVSRRGAAIAVAGRDQRTPGMSQARGVNSLRNGSGRFSGPA